MSEVSGVHEAVEAAGGSPSALAALVGGNVKRQHVEYWLTVKRVPPVHCPEVEKKTGIPCERLNADVDWSYLRRTPTPPEPARAD